MRTLRLLPLCLLIARGAMAQPACDLQLQLTPDFSYAVGSSNGGTAFAFTLNGEALEQGAMTQLALFHFDNSLSSTSGIGPTQAAGTSFAPGKFGTAVLFDSNASLSYPQAGNVSLYDGTIEMWVSPRYDGKNSIYTGGPTSNLFVYNDAANTSSRLVLAQGNYEGVSYLFVGAGGVYAGLPQYSSIAAWKAGEWHHAAFTYSTSQSRIRLYVDGALAQEQPLPVGAIAAGASTFSIGSGFGQGSNFALDDVRISNVEMPAGVIAFDAARNKALANNEEFLPLAGASPGQLNYSVPGCGSASYAYTGVPITNFSPPSGLLPAGSSAVTLSFNTTQPTTCRYSVGAALDFAAMSELDAVPATLHTAPASGLSSDPRVLNHVYLRCASNPDYLLGATYRVVGAPTGRFPRVGNIWLSGETYRNQPELAAKTQLFLGGLLTGGEASALRAQNPGALILTSVQLDDTFDLTLPENYYLHDIHGNRISDWCSPLSYIYNMTLPEVATYVGQQAYQKLAQSNWAFDGLFFDSFGTTKSESMLDCHGNTVQIDANGDGKPDNQAELSATWAAGMYIAVSTFRSLAPGAYVSGHVLENPAESRSLASFNGTALEFEQQYIREGQEPFGPLWSLYQTWQTQALQPAFTLMQSAPPNQLAYGYGYDPIHGMTAALAAFAQAWYPNMRFGLALALMGDGFSVHDVGDYAVGDHTVTWWYDEYDFDLGYPLGPPTRIGAADIFRREFTNGVVILNGMPTTQTLSDLSGLRRFQGSQAPLYQYIVDDAEDGFSATGAWNVVEYNTGAAWYAGSSSTLPPMPQNANGPYYHAWLGSSHQLDAPAGTAQWNLAIPADGSYTIQIWLPSAPNAGSWTKNAIYEVVSNGAIVSSASIDQSTAGAGDGWHTVATGVSLTAASAPFLRVSNGGSGSLIADAVYVTSAALYNDGSPAPQVTLGPFDGILLQRALPAINYGGLWWAVPAGSESGWGINFAHQGDSIFASWFTYDLTGKGLWVVMTAPKSAPNTYSGTFYTTTGPAFNAMPFNPVSVVSTAVGNGTLTFSDANNGSFSYTLNGVTQSKAITREVFGTLPSCVAAASSASLAAATNYQDLWWAAPAGSESGWGINLNHESDTIFATWFTYDLNGSPMWLVVTAAKSVLGVYTGTLYRTTGPAFSAVPFNPAKVVPTAVGNATLTFIDGNNASFAYTVNGVSQTKAITREVFSGAGTVCQ